MLLGAKSECKPAKGQYISEHCIIISAQADRLPDKHASTVEHMEPSEVQHLLIVKNPARTARTTIIEIESTGIIGLRDILSLHSLELRQNKIL